MLLALPLALASATAASAPQWGSWDGSWPQEPETVAAPSQDLLDRLWRAYRARSDQDGAVCPYYPTCSAYARGSLRTWGMPLGLLLTVDRLLREYPRMAEQDHYPVVSPHDHPRLYDPVPQRAGD